MLVYLRDGNPQVFRLRDRRFTTTLPWLQTKEGGGPRNILPGQERLRSTWPTLELLQGQTRGHSWPTGMERLFQPNTAILNVYKTLENLSTDQWACSG